MIDDALTRAPAWHKLRSLPGSSGDVPRAIAALLGATSEAEAREAYWRIDNRVVVQGQLFEAARYVIGPLVTALASGKPDFVRLCIMDLLVEIAYGEADTSESTSGDPLIADTCRNELRYGLWEYCHLLEDDEPGVVVSALDLLDRLEPDRGRLWDIARAITHSTSEARVLRRAAEIEAPELDSATSGA